MATAVSKPASQPPKMKRPPPPFVQTGVNGVKPSQPSASPSSSSKRLPGAGQPSSSSSAGGSAVNGTNNRPIQRPKKEMPKPNEPASRLQRPSTRTSVAEADRRVSKKFPEPYGLSFRRSMVWNDMLIHISNSENNILYSQEILKMSSFAHNTSSSHSFPIRSTGWQLPLQL